MIDQKQLKLKIDNLVNFIELQKSLSDRINNSEYIKELKSELKVLAGRQISNGSIMVGASYRSLLLDN